MGAPIHFSRSEQTTHKKLPIPDTHLMLASRSFRTLLEAILETTGHRLEVAHATRALTSAARALQRPVVYTALRPFRFRPNNTRLQCLILASG